MRDFLSSSSLLYCHFWNFSLDILRLPWQLTSSPEPMCLPTMTQMGREHATQCVRLVHADDLRIAPMAQYVAQRARMQKCVWWLVRAPSSS